MRPSVTRNLMTSSIHSLQHSGPVLVGIVNVTLAPVVAGNEKGSLDIILVKHVENGVGVDVRAIIKSKRDSPGRGAVREHCPIGDGTDLGTSNTLRALSARAEESITGVTVVQLTGGSCAIVLTCATVTAFRATGTGVTRAVALTTVGAGSTALQQMVFRRECGQEGTRLNHAGLKQQAGQSG